MNGARDQLLAGTRLTEHQHRGIGWRHLLHGPAHLEHLRAAGNDAFQRRITATEVQALVFVLQFVQTVGAIDDKTEQIGVDRLVEEIVGAHADRLQRMLTIIVAGHHDDLGVRRLTQNVFQRLETLARAIRVGWQAEIQRHDRRMMFADLIEGGLAVARDNDVVSLEAPLQLGLQTRVVLNNQQFP